MANKYRRALTREWLAAMLASDRTMDEIAAEAGCSRGALYGAMRREGVEGRGPARGKPRPDWTEVLTAEFLEERYLGAAMTMQDIAAEVGCSTGAVRRALERHGIPARPQARGGHRVYGPEVMPRPGESDLEAAIRSGADLATVTRRRLAAGVHRSLRANTDVEMLGMYRLLARGHRIQDLAVRLGVPYRTLWNRYDRWLRSQPITPAQAADMLSLAGPHMHAVMERRHGQGYPRPRRDGNYWRAEVYLWGIEHGRIKPRVYQRRGMVPGDDRRAT